MGGWDTKLEHGAISCQVLHGEDHGSEFIPTSVDELRVPIEIRDLGEVAMGHFAFEYQQFANSGEASACFECEACRTIEKFGKAIQFKETFLVQFRIVAVKPDKPS